MIKRWCKHGFFLWAFISQYYKINGETKTVKSVTKESTIKFYFWYVCDKFLVVSCIHKFMKSFEKNLQFIIDLLKKEVPYFLDLEMSPDGI